MGFEIIDSATLTRRHRGRLWHLLAAALGAIFVVAAAMAMAPLVFVVMAFVVLWIGGNRPDTSGIDARLGVFLGACLAVSFVCWRIGVRLFRGRRHLALFLRRFGYVPATQALTSAIGGSLGRGWRLVTLDDHQIAPVGVRRSSRWVVRLTRLALLGAAGAATVYAVNKLSDDSMRAMVDKLFRETHDNAVAQGQNQIGAAIGALIATLLVGIVVLALLVVIVIAPIALAGTGVLFLSAGSRGIRKAERAKAIVIDTSDQVERQTRAVVRRTGRVLAPRMVVARVATPIWQQVVASFVAASEIVVVDVSMATDNLLWELDLLSRVQARCLPVGLIDRLVALHDDTTSAASGLRGWLEGRQVVGYTSTDLEAFSAALRTLMTG
jgi:hypothetical protein